MGVNSYNFLFPRPQTARHFVLAGQHSLDLQGVLEVPLGIEWPFPLFWGGPEAFAELCHTFKR